MVATQPEVGQADILEGNARRIMAKRAMLALTWETRSERAELLAAINAALDRYNNRARP